MPNKPDLAALMQEAKVHSTYKYLPLHREGGVILDASDNPVINIEAANDSDVAFLIAAANAVPELLLLREFREAWQAYEDTHEILDVEIREGVTHEQADTAQERYFSAADALKEFYDAGK